MQKAYKWKRHLFDRGFTGHEHLDQFGLINMNARLYDPIVGQFFSPDGLASERPVVSPYAYCSNDPVNRTDPTGMWDGDYWKYNSKSQSFDFLFSDNISDGKNYILKLGSEAILDPDNFEIYPTDMQRRSIGENWKRYMSNKQSHTVEGYVYEGNFYEASGFGTDQVSGTVYSEGNPVYPQTFSQNTTIIAPFSEQGETSGVINLRYHFHPTARQKNYDRFNTTNSAPEYLFVQPTSKIDIENALEWQKLMTNGGALLQISAGEGVSFYNSTGVTLTMPINVFISPMKIKRK